MITVPRSRTLLAPLLCGTALAIACSGNDESTFGEGGGASSSGASGGSSGFGGSSGASSGSSGASSSGTGDDGGGCGATKVGAAARPVNLLVVVDKSGSMTGTPTGFGSNKWDALKSALGTALDAQKTKIAVGLKLFPDPAIALDCGTQGNCCTLTTSTIDVPIAAGTTSVSQITTALNATSPGGGTPTSSALKAAVDYFTTGAGKSLVGDKLVLLATDGGPNCGSVSSCAGTSCTINIDGQCPGGTANCCDPNSGVGDAKGCLDDAAVLTQVTALKAAGVKTIVVGIPGTELYETYLEQFAVAGGAPNPSAPPSYYKVSAAGGVAGLTNVFSTITGSLIKSCRLELQSPPPDPNKLNVYVDDVVVPQAGNDGWEIDNSTTPATVVLKGATCQKIETQGAATVEVRYGCPTVDPR